MTGLYPNILQVGINSPDFLLYLLDFSQWTLPTGLYAFIFIDQVKKIFVKVAHLFQGGDAFSKNIIAKGIGRSLCFQANIR